MMPRGVSVTLVEPRGPVNVGHVARLVRNFSIEKFYLVNPKVDISVAATYASHAAGALDEAIVTTLDKVREENEFLVATTAVKAKKNSNVIRRAVGPERLSEFLSAARSSSLIFGRDTTGLTNAEISICDVTTTIETAPDYRTLNVGHAVAIVLYLASRSQGVRRKAQSRTAREVFARNLFDLGKESGAPRHKTDSLFEEGKRLAAVSGLTDRQLNLLSGILGRGASEIRRLQNGDSNT